jgi:uncharacterized membrane protein
MNERQNPNVNPNLVRHIIWLNFIITQCVLLGILALLEWRQFGQFHIKRQQLLMDPAMDPVATGLAVVAIFVVIVAATYRVKLARLDTINFTQWIVVLALSELPGLLAFANGFLHLEGGAFRASPLVICTLYLLISAQPLSKKIDG